MKKFICLVLSVFLILSCVCISTMAAEDIRVVINGKEQNYDVMPVIVDGRTLVPMRAIFESLGAKGVSLLPSGHLQRAYVSGGVRGVCPDHFRHAREGGGQFRAEAELHFGHRCLGKLAFLLLGPDAGIGLVRGKMGVDGQRLHGHVLSRPLPFGALHVPAPFLEGSLGGREVIPQKRAPKRPFWRFGALLFFSLVMLHKSGERKSVKYYLLKKQKGMCYNKI